MKLYLIQDLDGKVYFQSLNKLNAIIKLNRLKKMKKYEDIKMYIAEDEDPYVIFFENGGNFFYKDYNNKIAARELARELFKERGLDTSVGIKDYLKTDGSFEMSDQEYDFNVKPIYSFLKEETHE